MAKKPKGQWKRLWSRWRKRVIVGGIVVAGLLVIGLVVNAVAGKDIRLWFMLREYEDILQERRTEEGMKKARELKEEIVGLGWNYRDALGRAVLAGNRSFDVQLEIAGILHDRPFHAPDLLYSALEEDEAVVRRTAAMILLSRESPELSRMGRPLPDRIYKVIEEWCGDPTDPHLFKVFANARFHRDDRLVDLLVPILDKRSQDYTNDLTGIGRANRNREQIAQVLQDYLKDERVAKVFEDVVRREGEADKVQFYVWKALASQGAAKDPELYLIGARSENPFVRQTVAEHLQDVNDPRVIPILRELLEDSAPLVRAGAVYSLLRMKSPILLEELHYLAEDSYPHIQGDLATATGMYGEPGEQIPFLIWCLGDDEPNVVEKAVVELYRKTKKHHGFDEEEWNAYRWNRPLEPGGRHGLLKAFIADEPRRKAAIEKWAEEYPPRYRDEDRVPHLIRQLAHADRENVKRAVKELVRITGRNEGFAEILYRDFESREDVQREADAMFLFMREQREGVIADWKAWYETWDRK